MNWDFLIAVDELAFELECAIDNLLAVHTVMESEEGASCEMRCNAVFSTYLQLRNIHAKLTRCVYQETKSRGKE